jgi:hypothetical protein
MVPFTGFDLDSLTILIEGRDISSSPVSTLLKFSCENDLFSSSVVDVGGFLLGGASFLAIDTVLPWIVTGGANDLELYSGTGGRSPLTSRLVSGISIILNPP